ncbi:hypothetical protein [Azospirillum sp. sgz302134]
MPIPSPSLPLAAGEGVEFGRFRLKPGVTEEAMRQAHAVMVERTLSKQPGWRGQHLVKLDDGLFIDLAFADARATAEAICARWVGQPDCDAFLALIEPDGMSFGSIL